MPELSDFPEKVERTAVKAALLSEYGRPLDIVERPAPHPGPGQVLVRVRACGVCGSDIFLQKGGFDSTLPIVPGHEASGTVEAVGEGVDSVEPGQPAALYYIDHCGQCGPCRKGAVNMCLNGRRMGVEFDGAYAELVVVPEHCVIPVRLDDDPAEIAVLTDAVATPYHALTSIARVSAGETVVVWGIGGIGSNAVQLAGYFGCRVVAVSRSGAKLELARRLGADQTIQADGGVVEAVKAETGPGGPDVIIQSVGSGVVDAQALAAAGIGTRVVLVGASTEPFSARSVDFIWREFSVHGSRGFTPSDINEVIALARAGKISTDHMLHNTRPLQEANEALEDLAAGRVLRSIITFGAGW